MAAKLGIRCAAAVLAVSATLVVAPVAAAGPKCTKTGPTTTQCETNGSAQIVTSPPNFNNNWYPYGGFGIGFGGFGW